MWEEKKGGKGEGENNVVECEEDKKEEEKS